MKNKFLTLVMSLSFIGTAFAQSAEGNNVEKKSVENPKVAKAVTLTLDKAIQMVLHNNLTLRSAKFDVLMSDTDFRSYMQKYSIRLGADGSYVDQTVPASGMVSVFGGDKTTQFDAGLSISKLFSTGTMLSAGIKEALYDQNDKAIPGFKATVDPAYNKPSLYVTVQQDLLKNAFGIADQKNMAILKNLTEMKRDNYIYQLSGLIVSALIDYWQVIIQENALKNSKKAMDATAQIRDIVARNAQYGLTETFEVNQYEALVAGAKSREDLTAFQRDQAIRKLLRTINMPEGTKIEGVTELSEDLPPMDLKKSLEAAYEKRTDYKNALRDIEVSELNLSLANHNALPSLTAFFTLSTASQSDVFSTAFSDALSLNYPTWKAGVSMSYPLWDQGIKTAIRNADYRLQQSKIHLEQLKKEMEDDVAEKFQAVTLQYNVMMNTKTMMRESQAYYEKIMQNAAKGRFNSIVAKNALDTIIDARQKMLEAIVQYNIALLQFDLSKNEIFDRYNIHITELLKNIE
ncbi:MAG: TolC family protein [Spirochaetia bacterium]|nr:TolC family protein [Spirochaetia bacterium]